MKISNVHVAGFPATQTTLNINQTCLQDQAFGQDLLDNAATPLASDPGRILSSPLISLLLNGFSWNFGRTGGVPFAQLFLQPAKAEVVRPTKGI